MNNREANWYLHPPACSCAACTHKRLNAPPPKSKPKPYNAKKTKKKAKHTNLHTDDWSRLMQALKPKEAALPGGVYPASEPSSQPGGKVGASPQLEPDLLKKCPDCGQAGLALNDAGSLYECRQCGISFSPASIDKADVES